MKWLVFDDAALWWNYSLIIQPAHFEVFFFFFFSFFKYTPKLINKPHCSSYSRYSALTPNILWLSEQTRVI